MSYNLFKTERFNILKPQPSPKSIRAPLTDITNLINIPISKSVQNKNQTKFMNNNIKINKKSLQKIDQHKSTQNQLNLYQQKKIKYHSLKLNNIKGQANQQSDLLGNLQKKRQLVNVKRQNNIIKIQKQSKMLKQIRQFLNDASQTSRIIKQRQKYHENKKNNELLANTKKISELKQQRDQILQQVKQKYQKQLINLQNQLYLKNVQIQKEIECLKQANLQLQQILTDIQNNISNLHSFDEKQFRCIMDHYWTKISFFQVNSKKDIKKYNCSISPTKTKKNLLKKNFGLIVDKKLKIRETSIVDDLAIIQKNTINFQDALKKTKSKTKLQLFNQQLKKAISQLQKQKATSQIQKQKVTSQIQKLNSSGNEQIIKNQQQTSRFNQSIIIDSLSQNKNNSYKQNSLQQQYTFKKPNLNIIQSLYQK